MTKRQPKTSRLLRITGQDVKLRLSAADRIFLADLAKVQIISRELTQTHHYAHLRSSDGTLKRLEAAGIITSKALHIAGEPSTRVYQFANQAVARAYGGGLPVTGAKRTDFHELMTARAYFALGRPVDFRVSARMSKTEIAMCGSMTPDALYTDEATGEVVLVEADSGHYTQRQIQKKLAVWRACGLSRQVWAQPRKVSAKVPTSAGIEVLRLFHE